jgi:type II secretory pathway pseudopilin PulG
VRRQRRGYTLLELALVCALLVVIAAVTFPSLATMYHQHRLGLATDSVREAWALARARAIEEGRPYRFAVIPDSGRFRVAPDSPEFWSGSGAPDAEANGTERPPLTLSRTLPGGVVFVMDGSGSSAGAGGGGWADDQGGEDDDDPGAPWKPVAVFMPDGTAQEDATIQFQGGGSRTATLRLRGLTGHASVTYGYAGEDR